MNQNSSVNYSTHYNIQRIYTPRHSHLIQEITTCKTERNIGEDGFIKLLYFCMVCNFDRYTYSLTMDRAAQTELPEAIEIYWL